MSHNTFHVQALTYLATHTQQSIAGQFENNLHAHIPLFVSVSSSIILIMTLTSNNYRKYSSSKLSIIANTTEYHLKTIPKQLPKHTVLGTINV